MRCNVDGRPVPQKQPPRGRAMKNGDGEGRVRPVGIQPVRGADRRRRRGRARRAAPVGPWVSGGWYHRYGGGFAPIGPLRAVNARTRWCVVEELAVPSGAVGRQAVQPWPKWESRTVLVKPDRINQVSLNNIYSYLHSNRVLPSGVSCTCEANEEFPDHHQIDTDIPGGF